MKNKIIELTKEIIYEGFLKFERHFFQQKKDDGELSDVFSREILIRKNSVAVLIHDPILNTFLFTRQFRSGAYYNGDPFICEVVAGLIVEGEDPVSAAIRETKEETGIEILKNIELIGEHYPTCGCCTEKITLFYANADLSQVNKNGGCEEEHEFIEIFTLTYEDTMNKFKNGFFKTSNGYISLLWFQNIKAK